MSQRRPAVAGMFYDADSEALIESIEECFLNRLGPGKLPQISQRNERRILGLVSPHAGFMYSGSAAAWAYDALANDGVPDTAVILGPNHHGVGEVIAVSIADEWITPLGTTKIDRETADAILAASEFARPDEQAHLREHSIEVQLPFLQYIGGGRLKIVPIALAYLRQSDAILVLRDLSKAIANAIQGKNAVVIASTDFTHYEPQFSAQEKDAAAMEKILALDAEGLLEVVNSRSTTMCGAVGTAVMIAACKYLGATSARKLAY
jgi:AmmeMemoRadiSam system protein B